MGAEKDDLMISGIQHFLFCKRQWALIHIEKQWQENLLTNEGRFLHERADNPKLREKRRGSILVHALHVRSNELGIYGICDAVEFTKSEDGARLHGRKGLFQPEVVEFKHGREKHDLSDTYQLLAESMCLEEMLGVTIQHGCLYYFATNKRVQIEFSEKMRVDLEHVISEMRTYWKRRYTPKVKTGKWCQRCSLAEVCLPVLMRKKSAKAYIESRLSE